MRTIKLTEKPVFLQISISRMGDKRGVSSDEIEVDADKELVKVRKVIFKSPHFDNIKNLDAEIRRYVRGMCFPYESGLHLVAQATISVIREKLESYHRTRFEYISLFAEHFKLLKSEFPEKLRKLYNERDYEVGDIFGQFSMSWQFIALDVPPDLEQVSAEMFREEKKKLEARMQEAYEEARMILRETCFELVNHLRQSLESDQYGVAKRLSSSTVTKLQEFLNNFDLRNITNDTELSRLVSSAREITDGISAESLRTLDGLRMRVRSDLEVIEEKLQESITIAPTRRIKGI